MVGEVSSTSSSSSSPRKVISLSGWPERGVVPPLPGPARRGRGPVAAAFGVVGAVGLGAFRGVPRLQCRQACAPAGIPEPGLAARLGGGCGRSDGLAGLPGCCGGRSRGSASAMGARGSRSSAGTLWPFRSATIRARPSRASPPRHRPGYRSAAHHGENRLRREGQPDGRPERAGVSAGRVPVGFAGTGLDQGFVLACWLRNAASPASDTSTHVLSGAAPAT
jgi:hypothetical protein